MSRRLLGPFDAYPAGTMRVVLTKAPGLLSRLFTKFIGRYTKSVSPNQIGKAGEDAVGAVFDIGRKKMFSINGRNRIPDGINSITLSEIKNVKSLSYTRQLRDFADIAKQQGLSFDLYVRPSTKMSGPLMNAIKDGTINLKFIPGAK